MTQDSRNGFISDPEICDLSAIFFDLTYDLIFLMELYGHT